MVLAICSRMLQYSLGVESLRALDAVGLRGGPATSSGCVIPCCAIDGPLASFSTHVVSPSDVQTPGNSRCCHHSEDLVTRRYPCPFFAYGIGSWNKKCFPAVACTLQSGMCAGLYELSPRCRRLETPRGPYPIFDVDSRFLVEVRLPLGPRSVDTSPLFGCQ